MNPLAKLRVGALAAIVFTGVAPGAEPQRNVKYDTKHERNVLDYWPATAKEKPASVFIWFHGGGFRQGDKNMDRGGSGRMREAYQKAGYAVVSCNYPFLSKEENINYMDIVIHCARAVQFVRSQAKEWNIDPERICCGGASAGALISEALGYHDDFADSGSKDPVAQLSSRPKVVISHMQPIGTREFALRYMEKGEAPLFVFSNAPESDRVHAPAEALKIRDKAKDLEIPCEAISLGRNKLTAVKDAKEMLGRQLKFCEKHLSK